MTQARFIFTDEADAIAYWAGREFKTFAVDIRTGPQRRPSTTRTLYVRARTAARAVACAQQEDWMKKRGARYVARLAGPRELGCVPTPDAPVLRPARADTCSLCETTAKGKPTPAPASGFGFEWGGRVYDRAQLSAALRCAEAIFTAYTRASEDLGLGSQSVQWADLDLAFDHSRDALPEGHRDRIDVACVAQYHGVEINGKGIVVQTDAADGELKMTSASIGEEHMRLLLESSGTLYVKNQDSVDLILCFAMDGETIMVDLDAIGGDAQ